MFVGYFAAAGMVQGLLEDAGITSYIRDEVMSTMHPVVGVARVEVARSDEKRARKVIEEGQATRTQRPAAGASSRRAWLIGPVLLLATAAVLVLLTQRSRGYGLSTNRRLSTSQEQAYGALDRGDYGAAAAAGWEAVRLMDRRGQGRELADMLVWLGNVESWRGDYENAEAAYARALDMQKQLGIRAADPRHVEALYGLGQAHFAQGEYAEARPLVQRLVDIRTAEFGEAHPEVVSGHWQLALVAQHVGDPAEATHHFQEAVRLRAQVLGPQHPGVAAILHDYRVFLLGTGDLEAADRVQTQIDGLLSAGTGASSGQ